jgi:hypothetical protein
MISTLLKPNSIDELHQWKTNLEKHIEEFNTTWMLYFQIQYTYEQLVTAILCLE